MKMKLLTLLVAAVLCSPALAIAQIGQTASLTGTVTDSSGAVLPGVTVTAASEAVLGGSRTTVTDENGVYRFPALPPGTYSVKVELSGFRTATHDARLQLGQTITVDAKLEPGGITETVEVTGAPPVVDVRSSSAQKNLTEEILEYIPYSIAVRSGRHHAGPRRQSEQPHRLRQRRRELERLPHRRRGHQRSGAAARSGCSPTTTGSRKSRSSVSARPRSTAASPAWPRTA